VDCGDALEAELAAMEEGLTLALHWTRDPIVVEIDCSEAIKLIDKKHPNLLRHTRRVCVIRKRIRER
jgi:hypothetical protein